MMSGLLLFASLFMFAVSSFQYTYVSGGLYRTYLGLFKGVAEASVFAYKSSGREEDYPYFDRNLFTDEVQSYFRDNVMPIIGKLNPEISFDYSGYPYSRSRPDIAYVRIRRSIGIYGEFDKTAKFQVVRS